MSADAKKVEPAWVRSVKSFLTGGFGGMCLVFVGQPLDTIKVRLQTSTAYKGVWDCASKTVQKEGIKGLYKGMSTPLVGISPIFALYFWGYDLGQRLSRSFYGQSASDKLSMGQICFAGGFSAFPATLLMGPVERVKIILQTQDPANPKYNGSVSVIKGLLKEGGVRSLFKGTLTTLMRDAPASVAWYGAYEYTKKILIAPDADFKDWKTTAAILVAGGNAGVANWLVAIPPDVIKSRWQSAPEGKYKSALDVLKTLVKEEGVAALYKGLGPAMIRAYPANAACFLGVEVAKAVLDKVW